MLRKKAILLYAITSLFLLSCKEGVKSGTAVSSFSGVDSVEVLSPTSVKLNWVKSDGITRYEVYADFQSEPIAEQVFESAIIEDLSADTSYTFKVLGFHDDGKVFGGSRQLEVTTWPTFSGVTELGFDENNNIVVSWDYPYGAEFLVYAIANESPSESNTSEWTEIQATASGVQGLTLKDLDMSTEYFITVHAKYGEDSYERAPATLTIQTPSSIPEPSYLIPPITIGNLPFAEVTPVVNGLFSANNYTSRLSLGGSYISDPVIGSGTLLFTSTGGAPTPGPVDNVTLEVNYNDGTTDETFRFNNLSTYVKDQESFIDVPPVAPGENLKGPAYFGDSMASGDFNCDGYEDLAVGMSKASLSSLGVGQPQAGAIVVYYSYRKPDTTYELKTSGDPSSTPATPGEDPQIITFDDLHTSAQFGISMDGGGNVNGDFLGANPCEDLVVGAPYQAQDGSAFVFFGSRNGLSSSIHVSDFAENVETCDGLKEEATCSPVRLWPDHSLWPASALGGLPYTPTTNTGEDGFGTAVAFLGDINGDGYDDIGIGAPYGDWDGEANPGTPGEAAYVRDAGYLALYFGSRYGIGSETPTATGIPSASDDRFRWLKVYAPVVESGMRFGASIDGGADVDGYFPVYSSDGNYYGGSDFIVGAPGFRYNDPATNGVEMDGTEGMYPFNGGWSRVSGVGDFDDPVSEFGISQSGGTSTGIAFLYFGRGSQADPGTNVEEPFRSNYYNCGTRSVPAASEHFSCFTANSNVRWIFPRESSGTGFGSSVQLLGDPSRYDNTKSLISSFSDPNQDGFAEVVVAAPYGDSALGSANIGHLWQFFGNPSRLFEGADFESINIAGDTTPTGEWRDNDAGCSDFGTPAGPGVMDACAPTLLRPNSVPTGARMGNFAESITSGDVTGDGIVDLIVGAPYDDIVDESGGAIYVFIGTPGFGLTTVFKKFYDSSGDSNDNLGYAVAVGNFDGDFNGALRPLRDVASGAPNDEEDRAGGGGAQLFLSNGSVVPSIMATSQVKLYDQLGGAQNSGHNLTRIVGDLNADGFDDAVGRIANIASNGNVEMDAVIYFGSSKGLVTTTFCKKKLSSVFLPGLEDASKCLPSESPVLGLTQPTVVLPQLIRKPLNLGSRWAEVATAAGDVNGDGYDDVYFLDDSNSVVLYFGSGGGVLATSQPKWLPVVGEPQIVTKSLVPRGMALESQCVTCTNNVSFRGILVKAGDFNGDGFSDVLVGDPNASSPLMNTASAPKLPPGNGYSPVNVGSGNGWECGNPIIAQYENDCQNGIEVDDHGAVYIMYGSNLGIQTPSLKGTHVEGTDFSEADATTMISGYGSEATPSQRACVGADSKVCLAQKLANPVFENIAYGFDLLGHAFGGQIEVMDWNADGIDDIVVAAPLFEDLICYDVDDDTDPLYKRDYGRLYLFAGSSEGILAADETDYYMGYNSSQSCPSILTNPTYDDLALGVAQLGNPQLRAIMPPIVNNNNVGRDFGRYMSVAGDLNNDGAEDLVVSLPYENNSSGHRPGHSYIYYGPFCGADNETALLSYTQNEANLNDQLDWNDPNDLVVLGSINFASDCQIGGSPKPPMQKFTVLNAGTNDQYGFSSLGSRAGTADVNKDGYDDFVIGSPHWEPSGSSLLDVGRGVLFFGGSKGLYTNNFPDTTVVADEEGNLKPYAIEPKHQFQDLGAFEMNMTGGDVNNDGSFDFTIPSRELDTDGEISGVNIGGFILFY